MTADREYAIVDGQQRAGQVRIDDRSVWVSIDNVVATLRRIAGDDARAGIPIGTRAATELEFTLNGVTIPLTLGSGGLTRRSFRISFDHDSTSYQFLPVTDYANALRIGRTELARYSTDEHGHTDVVDAGPQLPTASESAAGFALATAFGCGAQHALDALTEPFLNGTVSGK